MRKRLFRVLLTSASVLLPLAVFAESGQSEAKDSWMTFLINFGPWILFVAMFYFMFGRKMRCGTARQEQFVLRQQQHMERVEELLERLAVALERKDKP